GNMGRITLDILVLATLTPTKSKLPTGGVQMPTQRFITIIMPKCTGSTPSSVTMGKKIGVKMSTAGVMSINMPTINKIKLMISRITMGLSLKAIKEVLTVCGIFSSDITHDKAIEVAISSIKIAVVLTASTNIFSKFFREISL